MSPANMIWLSATRMASATVRHISLGTPPSFFYSPTWSPDSKKIAYSDKRLQLWYLDLDNPAPKLVDTDYFGGFGATQLNQTWSPDNKWIAYTRQLASGQHAVFVYSLEQGKAFQVTDGMSDALYPAWDKNGKYLYFTASTDVALSTAGLDMSSEEHRVSRSVYLAVLSKDEKSPLAPESDEEKSKDEKKAEDKAKDKDKDQAKDKDKNDKSKDDDKSADATRDKEQGRQRQRQERRARRRQDRHRRHRPAHSLAAHSRQELPEPASRQDGNHFPLRRPAGRHRRRLSAT